MCRVKSFSQRPNRNFYIVKVERDWGLSRTKDLPSAESHAELVRMIHEWISAVTERSDLSDNLVSLFMVRNLFTVDYDSGWQYLWISFVLYFGWNFTCKDALLSRLLSVFLCCCSAILANSNDTFHVNCACWRSRSANCGPLRENVAASLVRWLGSMNCVTAK